MREEGQTGGSPEGRDMLDPVAWWPILRIVRMFTKNNRGHGNIVSLCEKAKECG